MILRVYAMWNRSKTIFVLLLFIYVPQVLVNVVWELVYARPGGTLSVTVDQVLNYKSCTYSTTAPPGMYRTIPRFVLGSALLILAVIPTLTHSAEMHKLTKRWHTNRPMKLLVKEGSAYFIVNLLFNIVNAIQISSPELTLLVDSITYALCCVIMPRFIMAIRELYDRNSRDGWRGVDTGFGVFSVPASGGNEDVSAVFRVGLEEGQSNSSGVIELGEVRDGAWRQ